MPATVAIEDTPPANVTTLRPQNAEKKTPENGRGNISAHVRRLQEKHLALSRKIEVAQQTPGIDHVTISAMKRQKLILKEGIHRHGEQTLTATP